MLLAELTLWRQRDVFVQREFTFELTRFRRVAGSAWLACTQQTHCGMHASIFSHTRMTTRAGSLVYVRVESGRVRAREENMRIYRSFPAVLKWLWTSKGLYNASSVMLNNLLTSKGRFRSTRIYLWTDSISPCHRLCSAGLHTTDTLWHACIDFLTKVKSKV